MEYKTEYLQLAKNANTLTDLITASGLTQKHILILATQTNETDELINKEFYLEVKRIVEGKSIPRRRGQPTKFKEEYINAENYLSTCGREQTKLPTIEGFAIFLGVHRDTLYEWAKLNLEFSDTLRKIEILQKEQLINDGIYGGKEINATIVKLLLQNNHGMKERTDSTTNDKDMPTPIYGGQSTETI